MKLAVSPQPLPRGLPAVGRGASHHKLSASLGEQTAKGKPRPLQVITVGASRPV